ncbi:MAG: hypothetical protein IBJ11_00510 [Phycisphaerales bacterium]|nr:hypothetical protein [Phycisphaerales bacterium]
MRHHLVRQPTAAALLLAVGAASGLRAQEPSGPAPTPPTTAAAPAPPAEPGAEPARPAPPPATGPARIRFAFKDAPLDQVVDFFGRQAGLPVIRQAEAPAGSVTFISASEYELPEALRILNTILQTRGLMLRRDERFLYLQKLENMKAAPVPTFPKGQVPPEVTPDQIISAVLPLNNARAKSVAEQLGQLVAPYGAIVALPEQNAVIVTETAAQVRRLQTIIDSIDARPQFEEGVKLFPLRHIQAADALRSLRVLVAEKKTTVVIDKDGNRRTIAEDDMTGVRMEADPRTNSIVALGPEGRLRTIESLVRLLDVPDDGSGDSAPGGRDIAAFGVGAISAEDAASQLTRLFAQTPADRRPAISPVGPLQRVVVAGTVAQTRDAETLLKQLDPTAARITPGGVAGALPAVGVRTYRLAHARPEEISRTLRALASVPAGGVFAVPGVASRLTAEPGPGDTLVLTGPIAALERADELVAQLDKAAEKPDVQTSFVTLRHTRADRIQPVLSRLLAQRARALGPAAEQAVDVQSEPVTGRLIVTAPAAITGSAKELAAQLDEAAGELAKAREVRVVTLRHADAAEVQASLEGTINDPASPETPLVIRPDRAGNSLILRGTPAQVQQAETLAGSLDAAAAAAGRTLRTITVDTARTDAAALAQTLKRLLEQRGSGPIEIITIDELRKRQTKELPPAPAADPKPGAMRPAEPAPPEARRGVLLPARIRLIIGFVQTVATVVEPAAAKPAADAGVTIAVDPDTNTLTIVGSSRQADAVARLAETIQRELVAEPGKLRVVRLGGGSDPGQLAGILNAAFGQIGRRSAENPGGFSGRVGAVADPQGGALLVAANDADFATISQLITALVGPAQPSSLTVKIYPLSSISADRAAAAVRDLASASPRGEQARRFRPAPGQPLTVTITAPGQPDRTVTLDPASVRATPGPSASTLIVSAPAEALPLIDGFLAVLDQSPAAAGVAIRTYPLASAQASALAPTLQQAFDAARERAGADGRTRPRILADDRTNALLVTAGDADQAELARLLKQLDSADPGQARALAILPVQGGAAASAVSRIVEQAVIGNDPGRRSKVSVAADDAMNLLIVRAPEAELAQVKEVLKEVDRPGAAELPVRTVKLERADASQVAGALQRFFDDRARAGSRPGQRAQQRRVAVVGDRRSGSVLIAAGDADFDLVKGLIETFDQPRPGAAATLQFRVIPLANARVAEVADAVTSLAGELQWINAGGMGRDPGDGIADRITVRSDARSNSFVVMGQGESFTTIESIIRALDVPRPDQSKPAVRAFKVERADLAVVRRAVEAALGDPAKAQRFWEQPDPTLLRFESDPRTRSLIAIGPEQQMGAVADLIKTLEGQAAGGEIVVETLPLSFAEAARAAESLSRFFADRARLAGLDRPAVSVIGSRDGNALILTGPKDETLLAKDILARLDAPEASKDRAVEVLALKHADAQDASRALTLLFAPSGAQGDRRVTITPDVRTNAVIVSAPKAAIAQVQALLAQIDAPPAGVAVRLRSFGLKAGRADDVARTLREALELTDTATGRARAMQGNVRKFIAGDGGQPVQVRAQVTADRRSNTLLVSADEPSMKLVEQLIATLDEQPTVSETEYRVLGLRHAVASDISFTLRSLLERRARSGQANVPPASVSASSRDNTLLVAGTAEQIAEVEAILRQIDVPTKSNRSTEFIALRFADAAAVQEALSMFYGRFAFEAETPGARSVSIVADKATNSLVVSAGEDEWRGIRELLAKLDSEQYDASRQLTVIALQHADAASVARALQSAFEAPLRAEVDRRREDARQRGGRDGEPSLPAVLVQGQDVVSVSAEPITNSLIISASKRETERISAVARSLDKPDFADLPPPRLIALRAGKASDLARSVRAMYEADARTAPGRGAGVRGVVITGDDTTSTLIVRAPDEQFAQIKALADALQQQGDMARVSVRIITLRRQPAARVAATVQRAFAEAAKQNGEPLAVEADRRSNALVVASSQRLFEQIERVVRELEGTGDADGPQGALPQGLPNQGLFIIDLKNTSPEDARRVLESLGITREQPADRPGLVSEPVTVAALTSRRALAVLAAPADGRVIEDLVRSIDAEPVLAEQEVAVLPLKTAEASRVAAAMKAMLSPAQAQGQSKLAASLIEQVRRLRVRGDGTGPADKDPLVDLSVPVRVDAEPQTNSVVVTTSAANMPAMRELVSLLDRLPVGDAVVLRIFHLTNGSATRTAGVLRQLFAQGEAIRRSPSSRAVTEPTTETGRALGGEVAVAVDDRTNAIIVTGREESVALAEVLVRQLDSDEVANWIEPRVLPLRHADAVKLAATLNQVLVQGLGNTPEAAALQAQVGRIRVMKSGGEGQKDRAIEANLFAPMTRLQIIAERQLNALIILGSPANAAVVEELVRMLDVEAANRADAVRVYPLKFAAADRVAVLLESLFREQARRETLRPEDEVIVRPDPRTNTLVIATSARSFAVVEGLLKNLDREGMVPTVGLHLVPVGNNDARQLAPKIERLMRDRIAATAGSALASRDIVSVQADEATNSLIVAASDENLALVKDLVDTLSRGDRAAGQQMEVFSLRSAKAVDLIPILSELYVNEVNRTRGQGTLRVRADERLNAVVATGTEPDLARIRELIERLDGGAVASVGEIRIVPLKSSNALEMVNLLDNVLSGRPLGGRGPASRQSAMLRFVRSQAADRLGREKGGEATETEVSAAIREQVTLTPDLRTNSVIVSAPPAMMVLIDSLIADLEASAAGNRQIAVFNLENADAQNMAEILKELFNLRQQGNLFVLVPSGGARRQEPGAAPAAEGAAPPPPAPASAGAPTAFGDMSLSVVPDERQQLSITVDARTNSLLVSGTPQYLKLVEDVVKKLDSQRGTERQQLTYELKNARVDEVASALKTFIQQEQDQIARTLGPDRAGALQRRLEQEISVVGVPGSRRLILSTSPRYMEKVLGLVKELDRAPAQVLIQVMLAEVTLDTEGTWGVDFRAGPAGSRRVQGGYTAQGTGVLTSVGVPNFSVSSLDFSLLVRALEVQGRLEVLSRPQVLVNDNQKAQIQVGEEIRVVTNVERFGGQGNTRSDVQPRQVGVILNVTPAINADGYVRMDIAPEISSVTARTTQVSSDFEAPIISQRKAETTVTVKDGETIVIGGLIQNQAQTRKSKVPILGDIPILGLPFKTEKTTTAKTELLIILTPRVIQSDRDLRDLSEEEIERLTVPRDVKDALKNNEFIDFSKSPGAPGTPRPDERPPRRTPKWRDVTPASPTAAPPVESPDAPEEPDGRRSTTDPSPTPPPPPGEPPRTMRNGGRP